MRPSEWLQAFRSGIAAVERTPPEVLDRDVPSCPGWTVRSVIAHTAAVHRWAAGVIVGQRVPSSDEDAPTGEAVIPWYSAHAAALIAALESTTPDTPTKSVFGERPVAFWYRRQAHEVAVHRWDIEHGYHGWDAGPIEAGLAADGIAEWSEVFAPRFIGRGGGIPQDLQGTRILLHARDTGCSWVLQAEADTIRIVGKEGATDAAITASTSDLLLALWHRVPLSRMVIDGDINRAQQLLDLVKVT